MDISLQTQVSDIRVIDEERNYWFIRTYGGKIYNYFRENNFIGLGFNNVPYNYIKEAKPINEIVNGDEVSYVDFAAFNRLQKFINDNTAYIKGEATKWANQLIDFEHEIKIGDLVIIPNENSQDLSIGIVESETYVVDVQSTFKFNDKFEPYPEKRRKIKWLKEIPKGEFRGGLNSMFFSRTAVKNVTDFSDVIEGNLSSLYIKDEHIYLSIKIDQDEEINAFDLQRFLESLTYLYKEFCSVHGIEDNEELFIKIKVQSKGSALLKGLGYAALFSVAMIIVMSNNSNIELDLKNMKVKGGSEGFLKSLTDFRDANEIRDERKAEKALERQKELLKFKDSIEKLHAKPVSDSVTREQDTIDTRKK